MRFSNVAKFYELNAHYSARVRVHETALCLVFELLNAMSVHPKIIQFIDEAIDCANRKVCDGDEYIRYVCIYIANVRNSQCRLNTNHYTTRNRISNKLSKTCFAIGNNSFSKRGKSTLRLHSSQEAKAEKRTQTAHESNRIKCDEFIINECNWRKA